MRLCNLNRQLVLKIGFSAILDKESYRTMFKRKRYERTSSYNPKYNILSECFVSNLIIEHNFNLIAIFELLLSPSTEQKQRVNIITPYKLLDLPNQNC